ncbi:Uncharacterised protein PB.7077, partial [Pycnogonum litorale]
DNKLFQLNVLKMKLESESNAAQALLDNFWKLAETSDSVRISAAKSLISSLIKAQGSLKNGKLSDDLTYTIQRLIKGLSSQRKAARLGFFVVLCEILKRFDDVSVVQIVELINKFLDIKGSKQENSNFIIGQSLAYGAIIRSGRLRNASNDVLNQIIGNLYELQKYKSYTCTVINCVIYEALTQFSEKKFNKYILQHVKDNLTVGWENATCNNLLMLIACRKLFPNVVNESFLNQYWNSEDILSRANHKEISRILINSTEEHPCIHPVCDHVLEHAVNHSAFRTFWLQVVDEPLFDSRKDKLGFLGFELVKKVLPLIKKPAYFSHIFSRSFLQLLITSTSNKHLFLNSAAKHMCDYLIEFVKNCDDADVQWEIVQGLCSTPWSLMFDRQSHTKTLTCIVLNLKSEALSKYYESLKLVFLGNDNESEELRMFAIKQISSLMSLHSVMKDDDWKISILQFLFFHSFFTADQSDSNVVEIVGRAANLSPELKSSALVNFQSAVESLTKLGKRWKPHIISNLTILFKLVKFVDQLMNNRDVSAVDVNISEIKDAWKRSMKEVTKLNKNRMADEKNTESSSFLILYLYLMIQLFVLPTKTVEIIEEVEECCKRALTKRRKSTRNKDDVDTEEPVWIDVIVDVLLSMLSEGSKLTRTVVDNVFCLICPHLTVQSLQTILDVINADSGGDNPMVNEDDDDDDADSIDSESGESGNDDDDDDDAAKNGSDHDNQELRDKVMQALGSAVDVESGDESKEETYLDDEEMFKLDDAIAEAFKSMKKPKNRRHSKEDQSLLNFRLRCIDLLSIMISCEPKEDFLLRMILPVVSALRFGIQHQKFQSALVDKAKSCLNHICNTRRFADSNMDHSMLKDLLDTLLKRASSASNPIVSNVLKDCCTFVILRSRKDDVQEKIEFLKKGTRSSDVEANEVWYLKPIKKALEDFFVNANCHLQFQLFQTLMIRNRAVGWRLRQVVLKHIFNDSMRLFKRTQGLNLLSQMIRCGQHPVDVSLGEVKITT